MDDKSKEFLDATGGDARAALASKPVQGGEQSGKWEGAEEWMPLAWELCADECGEEACTELIWEGGPIHEPWGDRWLKYEGQAKEMIAMVRKHVPALAAQPVREPMWQPIETAPKDGSMFLCWVFAETWSSVDGGGSGQAHDTSGVDFGWWRPPHPDGGDGYFVNTSGQMGDRQDITHWMPLPAAPGATAEPVKAREPLTEEQLDEFASVCGFTGWSEWDGGAFQQLWYDFARAIERHHGITKE